MAVYSDINILGDIVDFHCGKLGERPALIFKDETTSYRQLQRRINQVTHGLMSLGVTRGTRVAYLGKNNEAYFEILLSLSKCAAVMVGVNWRLVADEVRYILQDAGATVLFVEPEFMPLLLSIRNQLPALQQVICLADESNASQKTSTQHVMPASYQHWRDKQSSESPSSTAKADDIVMQLYTSGTTGHPKGAQITNKAILSLRVAEDKAGPWSQWQIDDVALVAMPVFHIGGTAMGLQALYNGACAVLMPMADPGEIIRLTQQYQVTRTFLVPAAMLFVLNHPTCAPAAFESLKVLMYGASPIPLELLKQSMPVFNCQLVQIYGMTETAGAMTYLPPEDHQPDSPRIASCGKPFPGIQIRVVDSNGKPVADGEVGEIIIHSPSLMTGYWHLPEASEKALKNGWLYSGDAGYLDNDGYLYIYDRVKDMIISGGENIYPAEIENVLFDHPSVKDVAVIGVPSDKWGEVVKAIVVLKDDRKVDPSVLIEFARTRLAGYKIPKTVDFVSELPRNPSGKILKRELRKPYWTDQARAVH